MGLSSTTDTVRIPDEVLIGELACGDVRCFDLIFDRYHQQIYNFIKKQVSDHESVEDLVQEVFLRVYKSAKNFDVTKKFSSLPNEWSRTRRASCDTTARSWITHHG